MPNLLGVTNPVPNYDNTNSNRPIVNAQKPDNPLVQNVPDPTRVVRPDAKTEQQGADNPLASNNLRYDSNLQVFLQQLRNMPDLMGELSKVVTFLNGMVTTPGLDAGVVQELQTLLQMFQMDSEQFRSFFLSQIQTGTRFGGPLFAILRQAYQKAGSESAKEAILNFAKRYSDFSSTAHISNRILQELEQIRSRMPQSWQGQLSEQMALLENGLHSGDRAGSLKLLQGQILTYLGSYISRFHDMGAVRNFLSLLVLDMTRYENGMESELLMAFRQMSNYGDSLSGLSKLNDAEVWKLLKDNEFTLASKSDVFAEKMAQATTRALSGEFGTDMRESFQEILRALMINESVYMPLNHMMIPLEYQGKKMYSEFWVDPDAEEQSGERKGEKKIQFLFKMDIESLGFLEITLAAHNNQIDLSIYGPKGVTGNSSTVAKDLQDILQSHGFSENNIRVLDEKQPLTLTEVFPDLFEGKRSINVKI